MSQSLTPEMVLFHQNYLFFQLSLIDILFPGRKGQHSDSQVQYVFKEITFTVARCLHTNGTEV